MEHLNNHPHAFLKDGIVINITTFDGHDSELLEIIKQANNADLVLCCCDYGPAFVDGTFDGTRFYPEKPYLNWVWYNGDEQISERWIPPVPMPTDALYEWNQNDNKWEFIAPLED